MRHRLIAACLAPLIVVGGAGCPRRDAPAAASVTTEADAGASAAYEDRYPEDISLPPGVVYPCAVTPLPRDLNSLPAAERGYVNHVCASLIDVVREKQVLLHALANRRDRVDLTTYVAVSDDALARLRAEPLPDAGLAPFHEHVLAALELHRTFFEQAVTRAAAGASMRQVHEIPEGRTASQRLIAAWGVLDARYGRTWSPEVKDSVYHHLCALDLF